jgi:hypothetical protein
MFAAACENPAAPSADVTGAWDFTFSAFDRASCPGNGVVRGCAGSGRLDFLATMPIGATHSYRAACQSCGGAADYGVVEQPLRTARLTIDLLEFTLAACRFTATIPAMTAPDGRRHRRLRTESARSGSHRRLDHVEKVVRALPSWRGGVLRAIESVFQVPANARG